MVRPAGRLGAATAVPAALRRRLPWRPAGALTNCRRTPACAGPEQVAAIPRRSQLPGRARCTLFESVDVRLWQVDQSSAGASSDASGGGSGGGGGGESCGLCDADRMIAKLDLRVPPAVGETVMWLTLPLYPY